jgi:hyperosmotically inducible protein
MRIIKKLLLLAVVAVACVLVYNYWSGNGWTLRPSTESNDVKVATRKGTADIVMTASEKGREAVTKLESTLSESTVTAKIKSKMALDDSVRARTIGVGTVGSIVTLTGSVGSAAERARAVHLASDTDGVTKVVDHLDVKKR